MNIIYISFAIITVINFIALTFLLCLSSLYASIIGHAIYIDAMTQAESRTKTLELLRSLKGKVIKAFGDNCCVICMEEFASTDEVVQLRCHKSHVFHFTCMEVYLTRP